MKLCQLTADTAEVDTQTNVIWRASECPERLSVVGIATAVRILLLPVVPDLKA